MLFFARGWRLVPYLQQIHIIASAEYLRVELEAAKPWYLGGVLTDSRRGYGRSFASASAGNSGK
jgi:hypothetical protein